MTIFFTNYNNSSSSNTLFISLFLQLDWCYSYHQIYLSQRLVCCYYFLLKSQQCVPNIYWMTNCPFRLTLKTCKDWILTDLQAIYNIRALFLWFRQNRWLPRKSVCPVFPSCWLCSLDSQPLISSGCPKDPPPQLSELWEASSDPLSRRYLFLFCVWIAHYFLGWKAKCLCP